ncbi:ABC transporter ATP-binding protein [Paenibacillus sp. sgz500958]|uniref:ABC transporter ATP-binding protein n=1 Tax=Paenibacillus sp. sgz500958 TaxID=3242475 RepID=UPI0036D28145
MGILSVNQVSYTYRSKYQTIEALKNVSCVFETGKVAAITGESGSGKSTLLSLLAGLDLPTSGNIYVDNVDMASLDRDHYRRTMASVVYQSFNLFPLLTALENVMYPMEIQGKSRRKSTAVAVDLIDKVGLGKKALGQFPSMMSGGEQQRVAIARALAAGGKILLADEPTGNLDSANETIVVNLLKSLAHHHNYSVIIITHNKEIALQADAIYEMKDGEMTVDQPGW